MRKNVIGIRARSFDNCQTIGVKLVVVVWRVLYTGLGLKTELYSQNEKLGKISLKHKLNKKINLIFLVSNIKLINKIDFSFH